MILPISHKFWTKYIANEMKWIGLQATFVHIQDKLGQENHMRMVRWVRWHFPPDTGLEIQTLEVWVRSRYLSVTGALHNSFTSGWRRNIFVSFQIHCTEIYNIIGLGMQHCYSGLLTDFANWQSL